MSIDAASVASAESASYFPVATESIDASILEMDLYLKPADRGAYVLYRSTGVAFSAEDRIRLRDLGVNFLYVPIKQHGAYRKLLTEGLDHVYRDPGKGRQERVRLVRTSCERMIKDVLLFPGQQINVALVADVSDRFVHWANENDHEFSYLMDMSAHDYYTVTHLINTGVAAGLLIRALLPNQPDEHSTYIQGALLHDIGKREIPSHVLNKEGRLTAAEWEQIRRHPGIGFEEIKVQPNVSPIVIEMVHSHHERPDGTGYPNGLSGEAVGFAARVCAIVDVYDAISSARPYRSATPPRETLRIMEEGASKHFDPHILQTWAGLVEELLTKDPSRAARERADAGDHSLSEFGQAGPKAVVTASDRGSQCGWEDEMRGNERVPLRREIKARFLRQCKPYETPLERWFTVHTVDVSRGGIQIETPWPLTINDVLELLLFPEKGDDTPRPASVVRVRQRSNDVWLAGMQFVQRDDAPSGLGS